MLLQMPSEKEKEGKRTKKKLRTKLKEKLLLFGQKINKKI